MSELHQGLPAMTSNDPSTSYYESQSPRRASVPISTLVIRALAVLAGFGVLATPFFSTVFYDHEGNLTSEVTLLVAAGIGLLLIGAAAGTNWFRASLWFAVALFSQAVTFQLINAGWQLRYQHFKPLGEIITTDAGRIWLVFLGAQTLLVAFSIVRSLPDIYRWARTNLGRLQILLLAGFLVLPAAAVSPSVSGFLAELSFAVYIQVLNLATIVIGVVAIPGGVPHFVRYFICRSDNAENEDHNRSVFSDRVVVVLSIAVVCIAAFLCLVSYERHPHVPDEVAYLIQAGFFANGALALPAPPVPEAFDVYLMKYAGDKWFPVPPPGWPLILAIGAFFGVSWMVNPLLAGLNILLAYLVLRELVSKQTARLSVFLLSVSPWFVFLGMSFMTHMASLTFALLAALGVARARRGSGLSWAFIAGLSIGMVSLIRPLEALAVAGLIGLWSIGVLGKRLRVAAIAAMVFGTVIIGTAGLVYNATLTGDPRVFPINAYADEYFGKGANDYGFGPDRGMGWAQDPYPGHGPVDALVNSNLNASAINVELFGWATGSLLVVGLGLCLGRLERSDYMMIAVIAAVYALHFFYYFSGGPDFGGRYWFLMIVPLVVLAARGVRELASQIDEHFGGGGDRVYIAVIALCVMTAVNFIPWRAIDKYHNFRGMRPDIRYLSEEVRFGRSLVLVQGNKHPDYDSAAIYNPLDLHADSPIYAWDRDATVREKLLSAYPDRPVWIVRSPSLTSAGYQLAAGPLTAAELISERENAR